MSNVMPKSQMIAQSSYDDYSGGMEGFAGGSGGEDMFGYDTLVQQMGNSHSREQLMIPELQNFLKSSPLTLFNLPIGEGGVVTFKANLKPYTQLYVLAIDLTSVAQRQVDLEVEPTAKRDLSLTQCLSASDNS